MSLHQLPGLDIPDLASESGTVSIPLVEATRCLFDGGQGGSFHHVVWRWRRDLAKLACTP
jgi:hypothetical protein